MLIASFAYGMVYTWTDSSGIRHYTNKEYEIPVRYRPNAKSLYPEQVDTAAPSQQNHQIERLKSEAQSTPAVSQKSPVETPKPQQPVITPELPKNVSEMPVKRKRAPRIRDPEDE